MTGPTTHDRRLFLKQVLTTLVAGTLAHPLVAADRKKQIITVTGPIDARIMGQTLTHEHVLVDFIGAEDVNPPRWDREEVMAKMLPYLTEARNAGCRTFIDCTPNYLGRDVAMLKVLSQKSGLFIVTNTGYYGGSNHKFLPAHTFTETPQSLAKRWIREWTDGIDGTSVKPGFMKISVNRGALSEVSKKLITAAAITHLKTGLTIASHTGTAVPAFEQIEILRQHGVDPSAFIWVHSQIEEDVAQHIKAAREGAWVSLDGLRENNIDRYLSILTALKKEKCLHRVLLSHDAGWYDPAEPHGEVAPYTTLFRKMIPAMEQEGFTEAEIMQIIQDNAANAFAVGIKKWKRKKSG